MKNKILSFLLFAFFISFTNNALGATDENGQLIIDAPWVYGDIYHVDCFGENAIWAADLGGGYTQHYCDGDNDFIIPGMDYVTITIQNYYSNTSQELIPETIIEIQPLSPNEYQKYLIFKKMEISQTQIADVIASLFAVMSGFFLGIFIVTAVVSGYDWAWRLFKKAFPNAQR